MVEIKVQHRNLTIEEVFIRLRNMCGRLGEFDSATAEACISAIEAQLATARDERDEALRLAQWTRMTPDDMPSEGCVVFVRTKRGTVCAPYIASDHLTAEYTDFGLDHYFIAPPEVKP